MGPRYFVLNYKDGKINVFNQECDQVDEFCCGRMIAFKHIISASQYIILAIINVDEIRSIDSYEKYPA